MNHKNQKSSHKQNNQKQLHQRQQQRQQSQNPKNQMGLIPFSLIKEPANLLNLPLMNWMNLPFNMNFPNIASDFSVWEDEKSINIEAAVPGLNQDEIDVQYEKGILTIRANKMQKEEDKKKHYLRRSSQTFTYQMSLPQDVIPNTEKAQVKDGMLKISFQKQKKEQQPKNIPVKQA